MANQTVLIGKMDCKTATKAAIELKIGRPLSNPINTKKEGEDFEATLTGEIAITAFGKRKSAHLLTVEGYKIPVPANFDKAIHKKGETFKCVCLIADVEDEDGKPRKVRYCGFM